MIAKDGSLHWIRDEAIMVNDDHGQPLWSQGIIVDITERKLGEQQLHEAEERYRSLIETIPAATYIDTVEAVSQALYMSPQVEDIFGYAPDEWLRNPDLWEQGVEPEDLPEVAAKIQRLNRDGTPYEAEYRFRRPDGRVVWVHDQAVVIRDENGVPRLCQGVMFDITERRLAEEQLRETEERFRAIVEHVPAGIYVDAPDTSLKTMYASPQVEDITGIPPDEWAEDSGRVGGRPSSRRSRRECLGATSPPSPPRSRGATSTGCGPATGARSGCTTRRRSSTTMRDGTPCSSA
jgi:PAS domain S-box-containing protein